MTVRKIGLERTAGRLPLAAAMLAMGLVAPASAQDADTPAPTPAPSSIFRLPPADDGRAPNVQGPSDNGLAPLAPGERRGAQPRPAPAPTPAPQPSAPRVVTTQPRAAPTPAPATARPGAAQPGAQAAAPRPVPPSNASPVSASPLAAPDSAVPGVQPAAPVETAPAPAPASAPQPIDDVTGPDAPAGDSGGTPLWAWLLAGLAAAGAGIWYWRRRPALAGDAPADVGDSVEPLRPAPRAATPAPSPARPPVAPPASPPASSPPASSPPTPSLVTRPAPEQRAMVTMTLDIRGIRMLPDRVEVAFTLNLINQGPVAATGLMVRIAAGQGSAMPESVLARFFDGAGGSVLRDDMDLAPGASEQIGTEIMLARASVEPLMIGGKPMLIPVMAFDVTYHWDGPGEAFGQNAGSFVVGRAGGAGDRLAPLPLDGLARAIERPGARATAVRRIQ